MRERFLVRHRGWVLAATTILGLWLVDYGKEPELGAALLAGNVCFLGLLVWIHTSSERRSGK